MNDVRSLITEIENSKKVNNRVNENVKVKKVEWLMIDISGEYPDNWGTKILKQYVNSWNENVANNIQHSMYDINVKELLIKSAYMVEGGLRYISNEEEPVVRNQLRLNLFPIKNNSEIIITYDADYKDIEANVRIRSLKGERHRINRVLDKSLTKRVATYGIKNIGVENTTRTQINKLLTAIFNELFTILIADPLSLDAPAVT